MLNRKYWSALQYPSLTYGFPRFRNWFSNLFSRQSRVDRAGNLSVTRQQIYIVPTRYGFTFAIMVIAMLIGSNNYGINLGFLLTFLLAGIGLATMYQTWKNLVALQFSPLSPSPVFCGDIVEFSFYVYNNASSPRSGIQLKNAGNPVAFDLDADERALISYPVTTTHRGLLTPDRWTVMTYFPLGMFYSWAYFNSGQKCIVYPKPADSDFTIDMLFHEQETHRESDENMDFFGHRKYEPGDNLRRLDWKALARGRGHLIKQYVDNTTTDDIWLDWSRIPDADIEVKLSVLCRGVIELSRSGVQFGMILPGQTFQPKSGEKHQSACLMALALFE